MRKVESIRSFKNNFRSIKSFSTGNFWMPFTDNVNFRKSPKIFSRAKDLYYYLDDGKEILDGMSGLWCVNAGHCQPQIVEAIKKQAEKLDYASAFNVSHELPYKFSQKLLDLVPGRDFNDVFFTNCGSTAVDTALKIALQYHRAKGDSSRVKFIGRERGYHGVGFGGISVGGIVANRKTFAGNMLNQVDHISHTHSIKDMAFSKGMPEWGLHLADELERKILFHDPSTVAAVIIEPVAGSAAVLPPPVGYLERIREICTKYDVLLIFDEVITGFGRVGGPFATVKFDITPDIITCAKALTNATVPCGAVITKSHIFENIQSSAHKDKSGAGTQIEFFHGYTYSGHPLAMAAGIATLDFFKEHNLFDNDELAAYFQESFHSLKGLPNVVDIRNIGLMGAVEFEPIPNYPSKRSIDIFNRCFEHGVMLRSSGTSVVCAPPLIAKKSDIDRIFETLARSIKESAQNL